MKREIVVISYHVYPCALKQQEIVDCVLGLRLSADEHYSHEAAVFPQPAGYNEAVAAVFALAAYDQHLCGCLPADAVILSDYIGAG